MMNLKAEMARYGISNQDVRNLLHCSDKTVRNKLSGVTTFSVPEALKIRDAFFADMSLEYLFATTVPRDRPA